MSHEEIELFIQAAGIKATAELVSPGGYFDQPEWEVTLGVGGATHTMTYHSAMVDRVWKADASRKSRSDLAAWKYLKRKGRAKLSDCWNTKGHIPDTPHNRTIPEIQFYNDNTEPITPSVSDLLCCLSLDVGVAVSAPQFEDFCSEFGYDTDSRRAEKTFLACRDQYFGLLNLGLDLDALAQLFENY